MLLIFFVAFDFNYRKSFYFYSLRVKPSFLRSPQLPQVHMKWNNENHDFQFLGIGIEKSNHWVVWESARVGYRVVPVEDFESAAETEGDLRTESKKLRWWLIMVVAFTLGIHTKRCLPPSRERVHIPPWEKENHLETWLFRGHVSFQEGIFPMWWIQRFFFDFFAQTLGFHDPIDYIIFFQGVWNHQLL